MASSAESSRPEMQAKKKGLVITVERSLPTTDRRPWRSLLAKRMVGVQILRNLGGFEARRPRHA